MTTEQEACSKGLEVELDSNMQKELSESLSSSLPAAFQRKKSLCITSPNMCSVVHVHPKVLNSCFLSV